MAKNDKNNNNANRVANILNNYKKRLNNNFVVFDDESDIFDDELDFVYLKQVQKNTKERKWNAR